ncbi:hypothetical protein V2J56_02500 [Georgenia sp. MJ206]|uniref:hypothetical protein n=1 Tax=Georgenia wangjunii TaxID=3117730 RepID=UPI002F2650A4
MFVLTADQQSSRTRGDDVPALLAAIDAWARARPRSPFVLGPERTVGDEIQAALEDPTAVVSLALHIQRIGGWSVGIGAGAVDVPLAATSRASSGEAFIHARTAVERARGRTVPVPLAVEGMRAERAGEAEALLQILVGVQNRRTAAGWEVIDRLATGATQRAIAADLGISEQAVSQRLRTAMWEEQERLHPLAARLVAEAAGDAGAAGGPPARTGTP